jgi:hypothetical protein
MNRIKYVFFLMSLIAAAGLTYTLVTLKNIPDSFDWDLTDEENNESY